MKFVSLLAIAAIALTECGGSENKPCLTPAQVRAEVGKIDTYSVYDPLRPNTLERLSPDKVRAVLAVEDRACE